MQDRRNHKRKTISINRVSPADPHYRGDGLEINYGSFDTQAGRLLIAAYEGRVCYSGFTNPQTGAPAQEGMKRHLPLARFNKDEGAVGVIARHFLSVWEGFPEQEGPLELALHGTEMQQQVWEALLDIPRGQVRTYKDIAQAIGRPKSARPVGNAVGSNPVSLLVPCHRVLPSSGKIGNYGWGVEIKKKLLEHEGAL